MISPRPPSLHLWVLGFYPATKARAARTQVLSESQQHLSICILMMSLRSRFIGNLMCYGSLKTLTSCLIKTQILCLPRMTDSRQHLSAVAKGASCHILVLWKFPVLSGIVRPWSCYFAVTGTLFARVIGWLFWPICWSMSMVRISWTKTSCKKAIGGFTMP